MASDDAAPGPGLTDAARHALRQVAAMMIPASAEYRVPGADDELVFADMLRSTGRDTAAIARALADLDARAGGSFAGLDAARREAVAGEWRAAASPDFILLQRLVLQCYYRDDRVMRSLDMEPRPPFPKGHVVEQGDWSLLDPVRKRARMWRDAP
ncbi:MAG: hypothetical protein ABT00_14645 [Bordetella sp. SCN 68-11]|nr:MAG: hypothetical protein ABT00_14645 [Bordetella sp. SCN 68-11]OJY73090.1 MAG: hypothetical protein BGP12_08230 [Rhodospirillales bacterium 70-18]